jgi:phospholipid/cholesterol/gamma-HCH transport system substrate-binding protein
MNTEIKVGIFSLAGLLLLGLGIFLLGDFSIRKEYPLYVEFKDVAGLPDKSTVKLSGVEIGKVKDIAMDGDHVIVRVAVYDGVKIYRNSHFQIGSTSLIGSKYLQIDQGTSDSGVMEAGAHIQGDNTLPLDRMLTSTMASVQKLVDNVDQKGQLGKDLGATMANLRQLTANLNTLISSVQPRMEASMENVQSVSAKLDDLMAKVDLMMDKINSGQGTVGALVSDPKMKDDVKETMANVKDVTVKAKDILGRMGGFSVDWKYSTAYEPQADSWRSSFGIKISPRVGRYYYLGLANLRNTDDTLNPNNHQESNRVDAQLGWEGNNYDFYGGFVRGTGGVGIKYRPFSSDVLNRLWLTGEVSDLGRNRTINGMYLNKPQYSLGAEVKVNRNISVSARSADIEGTGNSQYGVNVSFDDKDIAYLLGLVSLGAMRSTGGN